MSVYEVPLRLITIKKMSPVEPKSDLRKLKKSLTEEPNSIETRERVLHQCSATSELRATEIYIQTILWFIQHHPDQDICRTPYCYVSAVESPKDYQTVKTAWLAKLEQNRHNTHIIRAAAFFVSLENLDEAIGLLRRGVSEIPDCAGLWLDLGRSAKSAQDKLKYFLHARELKSIHPNLSVWIATAAVRAGDLEQAEAESRGLIDSTKRIRARFGGTLDLSEQSGDLWRKACEATTNEAEATELVDAIADHAFKKHWGNTVLGLVALAHQDLEQAIYHLHESANLAPDHRLSSYGPAPDLLREICKLGRWSDAKNFLQSWGAIVANEKVQGWVKDVEHRRVPS